MTPFAPYEGDKPYLFISYAHADSAKVMNVVTKLHDLGYRIWYDEGIEVGSEWTECIASHLAGAHLVLAFVSDKYMKSDNCRRELHFAVQKKIKLINIFLEDTALSPGMEMQIGNVFALMKFRMDDKTFYDRLLSAPQMTTEHFTSDREELPKAERHSAQTLRREQEKEEKADRREEKRLRRQARKADGESRAKRRSKARKIVFGVLALLFLAAAVTFAVIGHFTGWTQRLLISREVTKVETLAPDTVAQFAEPLFEQAAREWTGIEKGDITVADLSSIRQLYFSGDTFRVGYRDDDVDLVLSLPASDTAGELRDLSDLQYFTGLTTLYVINEPLDTLETLPVCNLVYLYLQDCSVNSLKGIAKLPELRTLDMKDCPVNDLGDLDHCLELRSLSILGGFVNDFSSLKPLVKLAEFSVSDSSMGDIATVLRMSSLNSLSLINCDLRGDFFRAFDRERAITSLSLQNCQLSTTDNLEDFTGLSELMLCASGANLDWSALREINSLSKVKVDESMAETMTRALGGTSVTIEIVSE